MPANFASLRLRYFLEDPDTGPDLQFSLHSINFDINQATIAPDTPFTSELIAELKLDRTGSINSFSKLNTELTAFLPDTTSNLRVADKTVYLFENYVFSYGDGSPDNNDFDNNLLLDYHDIGLPFNDDNLFSSSFTQVLISPIQDGGQNPFDWVWSVKLKFHANWDGNKEDNTPYTSAVLYPRLVLEAGDDGLLVETDKDNRTLSPFNNELRLNYEVLYQPTSVNTGGAGDDVANSIGKASDELTDSISNLATTLNANLTGTFKTRLQSPGTFQTDDLALWVLIKKGTEALSFNNFHDYMDNIFCGANNGSTTEDHHDANRRLNRTRGFPFMNIDAYRSIKIATEAFVMVNCHVREQFEEADMKDLLERVPLVDGNLDTTSLDQWWADYKVKVYGVNNNKEVETIPYLAVIRNKLKDQDLKMTSFGGAFRDYINEESSDLDTCVGVISQKLEYPCFLELIWSYWHEECMMVQGLNAISRRFQNMKAPGRDPLAGMEIDPLRPLNNLIWGYIQDEQHRLSVKRRAFEYDHHYGISLKGAVTQKLQFADSRSKFIEAFHRLLNIVSRFYTQADDMTVNPDAFPVLNALREVHLILSEGAHNQYGDLPSVARSEMLMQQWLLARPEFREFLPTRIMVAYPEPWMDRVAAMNNLMGWTSASPAQFNTLAIFGEQLLLSIRFGNWSDTMIGPAQAANWARFWRQAIQSYIHSYRAVTNVDLSLETTQVDTVQPSVHLLRQLKAQRNGKKRVA